ncbi:MAG: hypothetical protein SPI53_01375 [Erysipelotrichaceae bacterium]|nr:hypothetical protein [Erysipelotrichaceae bacterium]
MFDSAYLKNLLKNNKNLIIFLTIVHFIAYPFNTITTNFIGGRLSFNMVTGAFLLLSIYFVIVNNYRFMKNKKAVDTYYALPIKRNVMFNTLFIATIAMTIIPYLVINIPTDILLEALFSSDFSIVILAVNKLLFVISIISFMSFMIFINNRANHAVDGLILMLGHSLLPIVFFFSLSLFFNRFVYGVNYDFFAYFQYLPLGGLIEQITKLSTNHAFSFGNSIHFIFLLLLGIVSLYLAKFDFKNYAPERAEQLSDNWVGYPFLIYGVTTMFLMGIIDVNMPIFKYFTLMFLVFIFYLISNFIYQRKIIFSIKKVIAFLMLTILVLSFCFIFIKFKAFGISYMHLSADRIAFNLRYVALNDNNIYISFDSNDKEVHKVIEAFNDKATDCYYSEIKLFNNDYSNIDRLDHSSIIYLNDKKVMDEGMELTKIDTVGIYNYNYSKDFVNNHINDFLMEVKKHENKLINIRIYIEDENYNFDELINYLKDYAKNTKKN